MGGHDVVGAADGAFAAVRGEDDDWGDGRFEGAVEISEAFDVEHVYLSCSVSGLFILSLRKELVLHR